MTKFLILLLLPVAQALPDIAFSSVLLGGYEIPPVDTSARGGATYRFYQNDTGSYLDFALGIYNPDGLDFFSSIGAHIHCGNRASNGPVAVFLVQAGPNVTNEFIVLNRPISDADIIASAGCGSTVTDLVTSFRRGNAYTNAHTVQNPGGEIRGQVAPSVAIDVRFTGTQASTVFTIDLSGLSLDAYITLTPNATAGNFTLRCVSDGAVLTYAKEGPWTTAASLDSDLGACGDYPGAIFASMLAGNIMIDMSLDSLPGTVLSEIVGDGYRPATTLAGANEVPLVATNVNGTAQFFGDVDFTFLSYIAFLNNPDAVPLMGGPGAHLHCGNSTSNGPVVAFLFYPTEFGITFPKFTVSGLLRVNDIINPACGSTIQALYRSIVEGNIYVNVHSNVNPLGEVRGQLEVEAVPTPAPVPAPPTSSGEGGRSRCGWCTLAMVAAFVSVSLY